MYFATAAHLFICKKSTAMRHKRQVNGVNAGSMADIAFLLLIFFLVASTIANNKGISVKLPAYYDGPPGQMADRNVLNIKINAADELLVEGQPANPDDLHERIVGFLVNETQLPTRPRQPADAVISLQNHTATTYEQYVRIYGIIKDAYRSLRNAKAEEDYGKTFTLCSTSQRNTIRQALPMRISEAEPFSQ